MTAGQRDDDIQELGERVVSLEEAHLELKLEVKRLAEQLAEQQFRIGE
jgi:hypothetical protein